MTASQACADAKSSMARLISKVSASMLATARPSPKAARSSSWLTRRGPASPGWRSLKQHRLEPAAAGRTRIVYRTEITGAASGQVGPELGPQITADFPEVVAALARRAGG